MPASAEGRNLGAAALPWTRRCPDAPRRAPLHHNGKVAGVKLDGEDGCASALDVAVLKNGGEPGVAVLRLAGHDVHNSR